MMPRTLIIGYGNPLRGDDGIGWVAARRLAENLADSEIHVLARQQLTPELAVDAAQVGQLVLIDATRDGIAGRIVVDKITPCDSTESAFTHQLKPGELLACAQEWYGAFPETWMVSVSGETFEYADKLSPKVEAALPEVMARVQQIVTGTRCTN